MQEMIASRVVRKTRIDETKARMARRSHKTKAHRTTTTQSGQNRLLVVVDESPSSANAVEYVAKMLGHRRGFEVCLAHYLPPLPPILLEFGGSENPDKERQLDNQLRKDQQQWIETARKKAEPALTSARVKLCQAGLAATSLSTDFSDPADEEGSASKAILELARRNRCRTIVVGRRSLSWFRRITGEKDLAERLVRQGKELTMWIVE